ncbi:hypothetical protein BDY24DRAFT_250504 [Mrakia frigida]|uniref:uncharacterized protein n=1 Tax=Mrakia frigida TaxID=29902 RepID=UPI003FCC1B3D
MDPQTKKMIEDMMKLTSHLGDQVQYQKMLHDPLYGQRGELPSALQVAQAFGCDDDKKENYLEVWNDYRKLQKLGDFVNQGITGRPGSEKMLNEFCSKYLPCFIRALRKSPDQSRELYSGLFVYLIPSPQFHRYLREHPGPSRSLSSLRFSLLDTRSDCVLLFISHHLQSRKDSSVGCARVSWTTS